MIIKGKIVASGISFVEITIGLFISSILSVSLFQFFAQVAKTSKTIGASLEYVTTIPTIFNQLERDISGIYVPEVLYEPKKKRKAPQATDEKGQLVKTEKLIQKKSEETELPTVYPQAFFCQSKNNQFMILSFITTSHLPRFKKMGPERNLVAYRLIPDKEYPDSFALVRQETQDILLPMKKFEEGVVVEYTLLRRIKQFKVHLFAPEKEKSAETREGVSAQKKPTIKPEKQKIVADYSWSPEDAKKKMGVLIPAYIEIEGLYTDSSGKQMREFKFAFKVATFADHAERMRQEREKKQQARKTKKQTEQKKTTENQKQVSQKKQTQGQPGSQKKPVKPLQSPLSQSGKRGPFGGSIQQTQMRGQTTTVGHQQRRGMR